MAQVGQLRAERENHVAWALEQARAEREADVTRLRADLERLSLNLEWLTDLQANALELEQVKRGVGELAGQLQALARQLESELNQLKWLADAKANRGEVCVMQDQIQQDLLPMRQQLRDYRRSLVDQERRLGWLLAEVRQRQTAPLDTVQRATLAEADDHRLDALYVSFEDQFRGTRSEIQQRLAGYLPCLRQAGVGGPADPILDLGCGRGEWLELLVQQGFLASGVDLNQAMITECQERGLMVEAADALAGLRARPDASLGAITGFQIIEHLPLDTLVRLVDEALRVVRPGGLLILETPNPENLMVSGYNFHFDPTHRRPLPPPLTQFLLEGRGWTPVEVVRLNAYPDDLRFTVDNSNLQIASWLNQVFCGPQDYAVIGHKP
jgi:O-antigen chain-terminating methyltransferase